MQYTPYSVILGEMIEIKILHTLYRCFTFLGVVIETDSRFMPDRVDGVLLFNCSATLGNWRLGGCWKLASASLGRAGWRAAASPSLPPAGNARPRASSETQRPPSRSRPCEWPTGPPPRRPPAAQHPACHPTRASLGTTWRTLGEHLAEVIAASRWSAAAPQRLAKNVGRPWRSLGILALQLGAWRRILGTAHRI